MGYAKKSVEAESERLRVSHAWSARGCPTDARIDDGDVDAIQADVLETPLVDRVTAESGDEVGEVGFAHDCELLLHLLGIRMLDAGQGVEGCALFGGESGV
ncbi:hypothetical protein [Streptomyces sp. NPDC002763]|uniref:hypothetical protein n=1 Tax=Streptomyces sp. NPDC002763 TaxID=3154427 RepID=UPI0033219F91